MHRQYRQLDSSEVPTRPPSGYQRDSSPRSPAQKQPAEPFRAASPIKPSTPEPKKQEDKPYNQDVSSPLPTSQRPTRVSSPAGSSRLSAGNITPPTPAARARPTPAPRSSIPQTQPKYQQNKQEVVKQEPDYQQMTKEELEQELRKAEKMFDNLKASMKQVWCARATMTGYVNTCIQLHTQIRQILPFLQSSLTIEFKKIKIILSKHGMFFVILTNHNSAAYLYFS